MLLKLTPSMERRCCRRMDIESVSGGRCWHVKSLQFSCPVMQTISKLSRNIRCCLKLAILRFTEIMSLVPRTRII